MARVMIDPNVRVRGNGTFAGFEDVTGAITVHMPVEVYEPESGLVGTGTITEIDSASELVYLSVDWAALRPDDAGAEHPPDVDVLVLGVGGVMVIGPLTLGVQEAKPWLAAAQAATTVKASTGWGGTPHLPGGFYLEPLVWRPVAGAATEVVQSVRMVAQ